MSYWRITAVHLRSSKSLPIESPCTICDILYQRTSVIYGARAAHIQPLQNVLNAAARLILHKWKYDHITSDIRDRLHWLPIQQRLEYKICLLIFKCLHQTAPVYLMNENDPVSASASQSHLRSAARGDLAVPRSRTTTYGQRSFSVAGPSLWNSLPLSVRDPSLTMTQFCRLFCFAEHIAPS